jgi:hypothetical protein
MNERLPEDSETRGQDAAPAPVIRTRRLLGWCLVVTLLAELVTLWLRFGAGISAAEFNRSAPLLLQIHHMFWGVPLLVVTPLFLRRPRAAEALVGVSLGLILSDLVHHFVVLPIAVGNTGWHWP